MIKRDIFKEIVRHSETIEPLDSMQRQHYESEWTDILSKQTHILRFWQDGKIVGKEEDELDGLIISSLLKLQDEDGAGGFVKAGHVVGEIFEHIDQLVGSQFIEYRLWRLISDGRISFKGLPTALHLYALRGNNNIKG